MWRKLIPVCMVTLFSIGIFSTPIDAKQGTADVQVSFSTKRQVTVEGSTSLIKGTKQHSYKAYFDGHETNNVVWEIKGNQSDKTKIDSGGFLSVGVGEQAADIEVIAYSANQVSNYSSSKVALVDKLYEITAIESSDVPTTPQTLPYGTTQNDLHKMFSKWNSYNVKFHTNDDQLYEIPITEADYSSTDIKSDQDGVIQPGTFTVVFAPKLPYVSIEYDGTLETKFDQATNLLGNREISVTYTVGEKPQEVPQPSNSSVKPIKGTAKAEESNAMFAILILLAGSFSLLCLSTVLYNHKHHNNNHI